MAILVADDNAAIRTLLTVMLRAWGLEAAMVADGRTVLEHLQLHTPEVILVEGSLPMVDGFELCSRIKRLRRLRGVPVVLLLNAGDEMGRVQASLVNANAVLSKPISGQALRQLLTQCLPNFAANNPQGGAADQNN